MADKSIILDDLDREILDYLQRKFGATPNYTEMAKKLKKPTATVHLRVKKLEKAGVIKGYRAVLSKEKVEKGMVMFVLVRTMKGIGEPYKVVERLSAIPQIKEIHYITGDYMFLLKIRVKDADEFMAVEKRLISPDIDFYTMMSSLKAFKEETAHILDL